MWLILKFNLKTCVIRPHRTKKVYYNKNYYYYYYYIWPVWRPSVVGQMSHVLMDVPSVLRDDSLHSYAAPSTSSTCIIIIVIIISSSSINKCHQTPQTLKHWLQTCPSTQTIMTSNAWNNQSATGHDDNRSTVQVIPYALWEIVLLWCTTLHQAASSKTASCANDGLSWCTTKTTQQAIRSKKN